MKGIELYIEKLHADAQDCHLISQMASHAAKRKVSTTFADIYRSLQAIGTDRGANAILDEEREKNLLSLLSGVADGSNSLAEIVRVGTDGSYHNVNSERRTCVLE